MNDVATVYTIILLLDELCVQMFELQFMVNWIGYLMISVLINIIAIQFLTTATHNTML